jgi:hypothetical protein
VEAVASNLQQRIDAAEKRGRATGATAEADLSERITKLRRTIALILTLAAMIGADVGLGLAGFRPAIVLIAGLMTVIAGAEGFRWVVDSKVRTSLFVAGVAATLAWTLLAAALGATNIWNTGDHAKPAQFPSPSSSSHKS